MAQWAVRLSESVIYNREITKMVEAETAEEARAVWEKRLDIDDETSEDYVSTIRDLVLYAADEDWCEDMSYLQAEVMSVSPWPPDTSAPARHLEIPSRLDRYRPAVLVYDTKTRRTHIAMYSPRDAETARVMYGATCRVIVVSWEQLRDALHLQRPLTV